jgi:hypothetical protein
MLWWRDRYNDQKNKIELSVIKLLFENWAGIDVKDDVSTKDLIMMIMMTIFLLIIMMMMMFWRRMDIPLCIAQTIIVDYLLDNVNIYSRTNVSKYVSEGSNGYSVVTNNHFIIWDTTITVYTLISTAVLYSSLPYSTLFNSILLHFSVCDRTIGDYPLHLRCQLFQFAYKLKQIFTLLIM